MRCPPPTRLCMLAFFVARICSALAHAGLGHAMLQLAGGSIYRGGRGILTFFLCLLYSDTVHHESHDGEAESWK